MREILFRGIKCDLRNNHFTKNKWAFGSLQNWGNNEYSILATVKKNGKSDCFYVDPTTIGQFTGLTDKNGKKIFEGDIVKFIDKLERQEFYGTVDFKNCSFVIEGDLFTHYRWIDYELEVIGNIHDNPELLGGAENV